AHFDVIIVTSPMRSSRHWVYERYEWLEHHFGIVKDQVCFWTDKHRVAGHVFIDDDIGHCEKWAARHIASHAFLWGAPYNRGLACEALGVWRVDGWQDLFNQLNNRFNLNMRI